MAGHLAYAIASNAQFTDYTSSGQRQQYVILQPWEVGRMRALKAARPNLEVLVYQNLIASETGTDDGLNMSPVAYEEANLAHPEWFLLNTSGQRFTLRNYSYQWAMDVGNPSYQQRWAENVIANVKAQGWDGVFIDNVNPTMKYYAEVSSVAKYPTDVAYAAATEAALAAITPSLRAAHMLVFADLGSWSKYSATVTPWLKYVDGAMEEMFVKFGSTAGTGYRDESEWMTQLNELRETQRQGKVFLAVTHSASNDEAAALYGWTSVLLGAEGKAAYEMASTYAEETWFPEYDYDVGAALGAETREANGVHRRAFANGLVLVNPTAAGQAVTFGGTYSGSGLTHATGATMPPHTGLVLLKAPPEVTSPTAGGTAEAMPSLAGRIPEVMPVAGVAPAPASTARRLQDGPKHVQKQATRRTRVGRRIRVLRHRRKRRALDHRRQVVASHHRSRRSQRH